MQRIAALGLAALMIVATGCSSTDDVARAGVHVLKGGDDALRTGAQFGDDIGRSTYVRTNFNPLAGGIAGAARSLRADGETEAALVGLGWEVACDAATKRVPTELNAFTAWVALKGARYGIEFLGDGAAMFAELLLASLEESPNPSTDACYRILDVAP